MNIAAKLIAAIKKHFAENHPVTQVARALEVRQRENNMAWVRDLRLHKEADHKDLGAVVRLVNIQHFAEAQVVNALITNLKLQYPKLSWPDTVDLNGVVETAMKAAGVPSSFAVSPTVVEISKKEKRAPKPEAQGA